MRGGFMATAKGRDGIAPAFVLPEYGTDPLLIALGREAFAAHSHKLKSLKPEKLAAANELA